jgi:hypothetical protein
MGQIQGGIAGQGGIVGQVGLPPETFTRRQLFVERYVLERAGSYRKGFEKEDAWQAALDSEKIYDMIAQRDRTYEEKKMAQTAQTAKMAQTAQGTAQMAQTAKMAQKMAQTAQGTAMQDIFKKIFT